MGRLPGFSRGYFPGLSKVNERATSTWIRDADTMRSRGRQLLQPWKRRPRSSSPGSGEPSSLLTEEMKAEHVFPCTPVTLKTNAGEANRTGKTCEENQNISRNIGDSPITTLAAAQRRAGHFGGAMFRIKWREINGRAWSGGIGPRRRPLPAASLRERTAKAVSEMILEVILKGLLMYLKWINIYTAINILTVKTTVL
ncbi:hypothetical protein SKAU_G00307480 [Synaphobranchus kaupii]|uniref:Uncharacterized protein n=1 Tax=Synaphobranchus kaupii TaxID=118154 RepID=A0A9Q1IIT9_SYNKA|nr:hypothetical protein SKAU_G00307480 [Synaphobranchus kaupii]